MAADARTVPPDHRPRRAIAGTVGWGWLALSALAVAVYAPLPYLVQPLDSAAAGGNEIAANYASRPGWVHGVLLTHVVFGGLALLLSPLQLAARVRTRLPRLHRATGRVVLASIALGGAAGFVLSWFNVAGAVGTAGFGTLAVLWTSFAVLGLRAILRRDVAAHRRWMLRAFAMTYAAVTLRLWLIVLIPLLDSFSAAYLLVPFLSWMPNLVVAELLIRRGIDRTVLT